MHQLDLALTVMGLAVVTIALLSAAIHRNPLSEPMLAMAVGVAREPSRTRAGSPGMRRTSTKVMMLMPSSTGRNCSGR